ncbi:hypothetical protein HDU76_009498, partial [Blyttiomyces sp. JEL0837]
MQSVNSKAPPLVLVVPSSETGGQPLVDEADSVLSAAGSVRKVSSSGSETLETISSEVAQLKASNSRLEDSNARLEDSNARLEAAVSLMAADLRNVNSVMGKLQEELTARTEKANKLARRILLDKTRSKISDDLGLELPFTEAHIPRIVDETRLDEVL